MDTPLQRYFIRMAYQGTAYHGWQVQENAHTIQAEVNTVLTTLMRKETHVVGCGRTDTGVHAKDFMVHFDTEKLPYPEKDMIHKLNCLLPFDIAVSDLFRVQPEMHARFSATSRTYQYFITQKKDPFLQQSAYYMHLPLDLEKMNKAGEWLLEVTDFSSFSKVGSDVNNHNCKVVAAAWEKRDDLLVFTVTADRFLRNMVRAMVGTLIEVGKGKIDLDEFKAIVAAKNRSKAGYSVPAAGLFLTGISYLEGMRYE